MSKKTNNKIWKVQDMFNYASKIYALNTKIDDYSGSDPTQAYKRDIRRKLVDLHLVWQDTNKGDYIYELPAEIAKTFIDTTMKDYFTNPIRFDESKAKAKYLEQDEALNKENFDKMVEESDYLSECYENGIDPYKCDIITQDEIEKSILKMMIKAIFNVFYDFDEEQYKKDYTELKSLVNSDDVYQTYQNGYSLLKNKMDNPIENYCTLKK